MHSLRSAAVQYTNYGTGGAFELPTQNGTLCIISLHVCIDIDECTSSPCGHNCTNTNGSFVCFCNVGYELNEDQYSCDGMHIQPCAVFCFFVWYNYSTVHCVVFPYMDSLHIRVCTLSSTKLNIYLYKKLINAHLKHKLHHSAVISDIDECTVGHLCDHTCNNTEGSYRCGCRSGYMLMLDGMMCRGKNKHCYKCTQYNTIISDINECVDDPGICGDICINTMGSYNCSCSIIGEVLTDDGNCTGKYVT